MATKCGTPIDFSSRFSAGTALSTFFDGLSVEVEASIWDETGEIGLGEDKTRSAGGETVTVGTVSEGTGTAVAAGTE